MDATSSSRRATLKVCKEKMVKKMIKIAVMMGLALAGLVSHADEVLYWMVDNPTITDWYYTQYKLADRQTTMDGNKMEFARVAAVRADQVADYNEKRFDSDVFTESDFVYLDLYYERGGSWVIDNPTGQGRDVAFITTGGKVEPYQRASIAASLTTARGDVDWTTYSFSVELGTFNEDGDWVLAAMSGTETYEALTGYISQQLVIPTQQIWTPGAFVAPEPTSGLLMVFGLALLGLKRKKEV